ncbi:MAG: hypothetical protein NC548_12700 [Lachnospiraceae bacterium]|nr:hypothetical protein [Lachnospiraceae bacterium]
MDDNSASLADELTSIYRLINGKQDKILPGTAGRIMTWSGVAGKIGSMEMVKSIQSDPSLRSNQKVPSERAVGDLLDTKVNSSTFLKHAEDMDIHISEMERARWNSMAEAATLEEHIQNIHLHISEAERTKWNAKADQSVIDDHIYNTGNPHNVTAHQVGTYNRREIDDMIASIRESFFNYLNINWDERSNRASLVEYNQDNWNPNYILNFEDNLPEVPDLSLTYFAVKPATDYTTNETPDCIIYIKRPGLSWLDVGMQAMNPGDMLIKYPETEMYVWMQGRFIKLFTGDTTGGGSTPVVPVPDGTKLWKPIIDDEGKISWVLSADTDTPESALIKGKDGYTPIKGVDYNDGEPGRGTPLGGLKKDILVKASDDDYDTEWISLAELLEGITINPDGDPTIPTTIKWDQIEDRPRAYTQFGYNEDGFIVQKTVTLRFEELSKKIEDALANIGGGGVDETLRKDFDDHINDYMNPHRVTPAIIGAVDTASFAEHVQNYHNPHNVTPSQIGLGDVDNVRDLDKPISRPTQKALDDLTDRLQEITNESNGLNYITSVSWNNEKAMLTFVFRNGQEIEITIPLAEVFQTVYFDKDTNELVMQLPNGTEHRVDITTLIKPYLGSISEHIQVTVQADNSIKASILPGAVGTNEIEASVHLRNSPTTTTQAVTDKSTRIATTEFVKNQVIDNLISYEVDRPLSANMGRILNQKKADVEDIIAILTDIQGVEVVDELDSTSPVAALSANMGRHLDLIKAPRIHTSSSGSTFGRATIDLFGHVAAAETDPLMDGLVFIGTDNGRYARADHRHPHDNTRAPVNFPDEINKIEKLTGEPKSVSPPNDSNDERIATTEWIRKNAIGVCKGECKTAGNRAVKIVTLRSTYVNPVVFMRQIGTMVSVTFSNEDKSGDEVTMLDVQGSGPAQILFGGVPLKNGMLGKNHEHAFVFDGENWRLINCVPGTGVGAGSGGIHFGPGGNDDDDDDHTHVDEDGDGKCDICGKDMPDDHEHVDNDHDGFCDICGEKTHECLDTDGDGKCDICGDDIHECVDDDDDGICDICGKPMFGFEDDDDYGNIINKYTGYHGMTIQGDGKIDSHGQVKRVWITIPFAPHSTDVEVQFSEHKNAFAVRVGDGTIIRCRNPKVIDVTRSSCIVQFLLETYYPANSICTFMYHTDKAWFKIVEINHRHIDENGNGKCDICGCIMPGHVHVDDNKDGYCDVCGNLMPNHVHVDKDGDNKCDLCGKDMPPDHEHYDNDGDGKCDQCGAEIPECVDNNHDGFCDICGKPMFGFPDDEDYGEIINQYTGYSGITYPGNGPVDTAGQVKRAMIAMTYAPKAEVPKITMSVHKNAWGLRMGDGTIMRCRSPKITEVTKSSCIIEFTLENYYPSNSPCMLMYHTKKGWLNID